VEPDYLPDAEVLCFQLCLYPMKYLHPRSMYSLPRGGVQRGDTASVGSGGSIPPAGGSRGKRAPAGVRGRSPRRKNCLIKVYCNFIVNLDRSLQGRRSNGRDYVRVFFPRRQPSFMREMYCGYVRG
jgi:hypothetical protein